MKRSEEHWKVVSTRQILKHGRIEVAEDTVRLPNGKESKYVYTPSGVDSVIIIALNEKNDVLLQREYSHPPGEVMWQLPGGSMHKGESVLAAAERELSEESGYAPGSSTLIGYYYANNRNSNKKQYVVLCKELYKRKLMHDDDEFIDSYWMSEPVVHDMIREGKFNNINLLAALNVWFHRKTI